ncbi:hypothetical protein COCOBI_01-1360 [Coccomyxa sp. Obi]|nr:hypothetical protein COCOBI_01-1360 [Coccomyxa sp. Obi]
MDCYPPPGAQVLSPLAHRPADMDVDVPPPAPAPDSPMECDTAAADAGFMPPGCRVQTAAHPPADVAMDCDYPPLTHTDAPEPDVAQHGTSSPPPLELSGVASTRIEECFSWIAGHTDFGTAQARAAICALHAPPALISWVPPAGRLSRAPRNLGGLPRSEGGLCRSHQSEKTIPPGS